MKHYTDSHEWISIEGKRGTVGITDFAKKELGEIVHIELPMVGRKVKAGEEVVVLESTKAAADIYAPVSGTILAVHDALKAHPNALIAHEAPHDWLFQVEIAQPKELEHLMSEA
ncbi:MAG: Glycine cleavage system protein, partial [Chlamydiota bacterium]